MNWSNRSIGQSIGVSVGLMLLGLVFGVIAVNVTFQFTTFVGIAETEYGLWVTRYGLQYGYLMLAVLYIVYRDSTDRFIQIKRPDLEGIAWIVLAPVVLIGLSLVFNPVLTAIGIEMSTGELTADPTRSLSQFVVFFVVAWLVAAPSEELLFRGVIQGRLRETMGPIWGVMVAAIIFALMHVFIGVLDGQQVEGVVGWGVETLTRGLVFGAAYERTENLVIPSVIHATTWTLPYFGVV